MSQQFKSQMRLKSANLKYMHFRYIKGISILIVIIPSTSATAPFLISEKMLLEPRVKNLLEKKLKKLQQNQMMI